MYIKSLYLEFIQSRPFVKDIRTEQALRKQVMMFVEFIENNKLDISATSINLYVNYISQHKDSTGLTPNLSWYKKHFIHLHVFIKYLLNNKHISFNPFPYNIPSWALNTFNKRLKDIVRDRQDEFNKSKKNIDDIVDEYICHCDKYFTDNRCKRNNERMLTWLREIKVDVLSISQGDVNVIIDYFLNQSKYFSKKMNINLIKSHVIRLIYFYKWLYQSGYILVNSFKDYNLKSLKVRFNQLNNSNVKRSRYYSVKEILKAYKKFLNSKVKSYVVLETYYKALLQFIRFIVSRDYTLYTVDSKIVSAYKEYLINYEIQPKEYLKPNTQARKISRVKRFYDWFVDEKYITSNPFNTYNATQHELYINSIYTARNLEKVIKHDIPLVFQSIYNGVLEYEQSINISPLTIKNHVCGWKFFFNYLDNIQTNDLKQVDELTLHEYQVYLHHYKKKNGEQISLNTVTRYLAGLKSLYRYLLKFRMLDRDPSHAITFPKNNTGLSTSGIQDKEMKRILDMPRITTELGLRDKAMLEVLYSTGIRVNELCELKLKNIDMHGGLLKVDVAKGGRKYERIIPIGKIACDWVDRYVKEIRYKYAMKDSDYLFVNNKGNAYHKSTPLRIVKHYSKKAGLNGKKVVTHSFRVSCATEMLKNGANIKHIKEQLGHASIQSTEKYIRLMPIDLKKIHSKFHPREKI